MGIERDLLSFSISCDLAETFWVLGDCMNVYVDPSEVVRSFIAEMYAWELQAHSDSRASKGSDPDGFWLKTNASLGDVFSRWCTPKERRYGRLGSFSNPPEYQPDHEAILETIVESTRRACVYTQQGTSFRLKRMYVLLKKSDRWLIDSVKWYDSIKDKWANGIL